MKKIYLIITVIILAFVNTTKAQYISEKSKGLIPPIICYASGKIEKISIPPPAGLFLKSNDTKLSEINVTYSLFPAEAKAAFEYAINIWEHLVQSDIPINVQANWRSQDMGTLGSTAPADYVTNFNNIPHKNRYYALPVAERLAKEDINPYSSPDIVCTFNKDQDWYFGTDGNTPENLYDFVTVVLHEIAHGLGFTGFFYVQNNIGSYAYNAVGDAAAFDLLVVNTGNQYLVDTAIFNVPSNKLYFALISGSLFAKSPSAIFDNYGNGPQLFVPNPFDSGASVYHLNDKTYPPSSGNSLMTHAIGLGESVQDPGPLAMGILDDIGWKYMFLNLDKPKDMEQKNPIVFNMTVESDYPLDSTSLYVVYSATSSENLSDSLPMVYNNSTGFFTATILPETDSSKYYYYVTAKDVKNRFFRLPTEAPDEYYSVTIGPDLEKPVITHTPIPYFVTTEKEIPVSAYVDDNLGVDTVYIEYDINSVAQPPFGLTKDSVTFYKGIFPVNINALNDGDEITYRIVAIDSALAKNVAASPSEGSYSFKIERIFNPVIQYTNDFNTTTPDFILFDFDIYQDTGFENGSLNSPHPYPSPKQNNKDFNFTTMLKHPIILQQDASISYDEVVLVEPGETLSKYGDDNFWDYVIVEGSKDEGKTWLPLIDGYDSGDNANWLSNYNQNIVDQTSQAVGVPDWYVNRKFDMLQTGNFVAGDTILIRFRLFSDPYANGWGWTIDNLQIQTPVSASVLALSPGNVQIYPNPFNDRINISIQPKQTVDNLEIEVFNLYGLKIHSRQYESVMGEFSENIDMNSYPDGMYLISIEENGIKVFSKKVIKQ